MLRLSFVSLATILSLPIADLLYIGLTLLLLLASWGFIGLCDRLTEDTK